MALDRYESTARLGSVNPITDIGSRQALNSSQSLEKRLDSISEFALGKLTEKASTEGQLYAVKNAPTLEQVTTAVGRGEDVNALFEKEGSVFGDSARKVQAELFRQDSYSTFSRRVEEMSSALDSSGVISFDDVDAMGLNLQAEINGTYDVLKNIDPEQALKFNAQANILGNTLYEKVNLKALKLQGEIKLEEAKDFQKSYESNFIMTLIGANGDLATTKVKMAGDKRDLRDSYALVKGGVKLIGDMDLLEDALMVQAAGKILASDPKYYNNFSKTYRQLSTNNPPEELAFFNSLDRTSQLKVLQGARTEAAALDAISIAKQNKEKLNDSLEANILANSYLEKQTPETLAKLRVISNRNPAAFSYNQIKVLLKDKESWKVNPETKYTTQSRQFTENIITGMYLDYDAMSAAATQEGFGESEINQIFAPQLASRQVALYEQGLANSAISIISPNANSSKRARAENDINSIVEEKVKQLQIEGKPVDRLVILSEATKTVQSGRELKTLALKLDKLDTTFSQYKLLDIYAEFPRTNDGRLIIDMDSPAMKVILMRIEQENPSALSAIKAELETIQRLQNQQDNM